MKNISHRTSDIVSDVEKYICLCNNKLTNGVGVRKLKVTDYKNYISLLSQLTEVGNITKEIFTDRLREIEQNRYLYLYVMYNKRTDELIASGTVYIEPKFIHGCSKVGHIEDIVVNNNYRGKNYGHSIIKMLVKIAHIVGCYKVTLACKKRNVDFYEKCQFKQEGYEMVTRL